MKERIKKCFKELMPYIIILIVVIIIKLYVVAPIRVNGPSMNDTLKNNDIMILDEISYRFQNVDNFIVNKGNQKELTLEEVHEYIKKIENNGYVKAFDTSKVDYQYSIGDMKSRIQLQDIENIGLLIYYDNPDYYELPFDAQRNALINELNSYGFDFDYDTLGLDKLRTLYYKKEMYSKNQNG